MEAVTLRHVDKSYTTYGTEVVLTGQVQPAGEVREVLIPAEFDESFTAYNALQQEAGMDLSPCRGKRVKCWTYTVTNYPGDDTVQAHLYVYRDTVVGGDISSTRQDGVRQGLRPMTPAAP